MFKPIKNKKNNEAQSFLIGHFKLHVSKLLNFDHQFHESKRYNKTCKKWLLKLVHSFFLKAHELFGRSLR